VRVTGISRQLADLTNADLDVGVGGGIFETVPRAKVCVDVDLPRKPPELFIRASVEFLPFRSKTFEIVKAYNMLEHVAHPTAGIQEILRVGSVLIARQDSWMSLAMWATPEHEWLQLPGLRFLKFPRTRIGIQTSRALRRIAMTPRFGRWLSRAHVMFRWNHYIIQAD